MSTEWKDYEQVAAYLLDQNAKEFGLYRVEAKQHVTGQESGTTWEIDAKGARHDNEAYVLWGRPLKGVSRKKTPPRKKKHAVFSLTL